MGRRFGWRAAVLLVPAAVLVLTGGLPRVARAQEVVALLPGCNNVTLTDPAGTPLRTVAARIQPSGALTAIFRYDTAAVRFLGFAPDAPDAVNDYAAVSAPIEAVFICVNAPGSFTRGGTPAVAATPAPPPVVAPGFILAPASVNRGDTAEVQVGTVPGWACVGGVNVPNGSTFRFIPIEVAAAPNGIAVIRFDTLTTDSSGTALLSIRCADGRFIMIQIHVI